MHEVKFIDGTPVPDDYLTAVSLLVRDAALAIDMFGEDELEGACRERTSQDAGERHMEQKRCCVCGEEMVDDESSAFDTCEDCLDNVHRDPESLIERAFSGVGETREASSQPGNAYVLRTCAGLGRGDVDAVHSTLEAAIAAFDAAPVNSIPRVIRNGETLIERDPEAGLAPMFWDAEVERVYRELRQPPPPVASS
jgi:hypothetical protein